MVVIAAPKLLAESRASSNPSAARLRHSSGPYIRGNQGAMNEDGQGRYEGVGGKPLAHRTSHERARSDYGGLRVRQ